MDEQQSIIAEVSEALAMLGQGYEQVRVKDESNDHKYFTITPRIVKAYARNAHDLALWETVKDVAGESGECYLNTEQLGILAGISAGQVSNSRKYWLKIGFLKGEIRKDPGYSQAVWHLSIPDLWAKNVEYCEKYPKIADRLAFRMEHKSLHRMKASPSESKPSPTETKKMLIKKNHLKGGLSEKDIADANREVDAILENQKKVKYPYRDEFPEPYLIWADLYVELTKQKPTKGDILEWMSTFETWKAKELQPEHIRAAWAHANRPDGGFAVGRPAALTNTAVGMKSKMIAAAPSAPAINEQAVQESQKMLAKKWNIKPVPRPASLERPRIGRQP